MNVMDRLMQKVERSADGCWLFTGCVGKNGYGRFSYQGRAMGAHRAAYLMFVGPIPDGLHLDHLCRVRNCVNPEHLEPVTPRENNRRGVSLSALNAVKTHCKRGHEFTAENTRVNSDGQRVCRECHKLTERARRAVAALSRAPRPLKTHCIRGHEFTSENTYMAGKKRVCRQCHAMHARNRRRQLKAESALLTEPCCADERDHELGRHSPGVGA